MSRSPLLPLTIAAVLGLAVSLQAQTTTNNYNQTNQGPNVSGGAGLQSDPLTNTPSTTDNSRPTKQKAEEPEPATDPETGDNTLYRMKTSESLAEGAMGRSDGQLTSKPRKKEHVLEIDSNKLHTGGTDPKFQGSLLNNSVTSIDDVSAKAQDEDDSKNKDEAQDQDDSDSRFKRKRLVFKRGAEEKENKSARTTAESSPSPSPSASASASPKSR